MDSLRCDDLTWRLPIPLLPFTLYPLHSPLPSLHHTRSPHHHIHILYDLSTTAFSHTKNQPQQALYTSSLSLHVINIGRPSSFRPLVLISSFLLCLLILFSVLDIVCMRSLGIRMDFTLLYIPRRSLPFFFLICMSCSTSHQYCTKS
jgi:hypothetical protein